MPEPETISGQPCPFCNTDNLILSEGETEIPFFGKVYLFSMTCTNCKYHKADVEAAEDKEPSRYELDVNGEADMSIRVIKSSEATVKVSNIGSITSGPASNGFITNIEGILSRMKVQVEQLKNDADADDDETREKAKKMLRKIQDIIWGHETCKITIEDPTGNSAIISEKAKKTPLKVSKKKE